MTLYAEERGSIARFTAPFATAATVLAIVVFAHTRFDRSVPTQSGPSSRDPASARRVARASVPGRFSSRPGAFGVELGGQALRDPQRLRPSQEEQLCAPRYVALPRGGV